MLDGSISTRDLCFLFKEDIKGILFDVSRSSMKDFDYAALEAAKNGFIVSGKYAGRVNRFDPVEVVVFANEYPNYSELSPDRWQTATLGEGSLSDLSMIPSIIPTEFPFVPPPDMPSLDENFNHRAFIEGLDVAEEGEELGSQEVAVEVGEVNVTQGAIPSTEVDRPQSKLY